MEKKEVVIIGGGVAGVSASLAAAGMGAKTTLVESSKKVGVSKTLLPFLISDGWGLEDAILPETGSLGEAGVEVTTGEAVKSVSHRDRTIRLESDRRERTMRYDSLVVCTGATSEVPQLRGVSKPNVYVLGTPVDYLRLSRELDSLSSVAISGPIPIVLKLGETMTAKGKLARVFCGRGGLERQFSVDVAGMIRRRAASGRGGKGTRPPLVESSIDSILGVDRAEAVVSEGVVYTCDAVIVVPRSVPSYPAVECLKGRNGGLLVDASMSTSLPEVFAAGDSAEIRFRSSSVPARLYSTSRMCGEVAGTNAAGGRASAAPSWAVEHVYFGLEYCSAGLSEEDANAMGVDAAAGVGESRGQGRLKGGGERDRATTLVSIVYDRSTHQVYGLEIAGWRALSLSSTASLIVSLGLSLEQIVRVESAYSPDSGDEGSPIRLTARKILARAKQEWEPGS